MSTRHVELGQRHLRLVWDRKLTCRCLFDWKDNSVSSTLSSPECFPKVIMLLNAHYSLTKILRNFATNSRDVGLQMIHVCLDVSYASKNNNTPCMIHSFEVNTVPHQGKVSLVFHGSLYKTFYYLSWMELERTIGSSIDQPTALIKAS